MTRPANEVYRCPTPCDDDCELNGWSCHEAHDVPSRREHDAAACEALALAGNLRWLLDAGWRVALGRCREPHDPAQPWYLQMMIVGSAQNMRHLDGTGPGDLLARAVERLQREGAAP
jgi:hypothetical protein